MRLHGSEPYRGGEEQWLKTSKSQHTPFQMVGGTPTIQAKHATLVNASKTCFHIQVVTPTSRCLAQVTNMPWYSTWCSYSDNWKPVEIDV